MFRRLIQSDYEMTMQFLGQNPGLNLFQIGDIENYGFDSDIQTVWGTFDENKALTGVLLRYRENYIPYFIDADQSVSYFKDQISQDEDIKIISGKSDIVNQFKSCFEQSLTIEEFDTKNRHSVERIRQKIEDQSGRIYFIENENEKVICTVQTAAENENEKVICTVQTAAENSKSAMVVSVATHQDYRRQGLMAQALSRLCQDLLSEGKTLCLFYDNPEAGSVYHKLGFKMIGKWRMIIRQ